VLPLLLPVLCIVRLDAQTPPERSGYLSGIRRLGPGQLLDLDTGGVFERSLSLPGLRAEIEAAADAEPWVDAAPDEAIAAAQPWLSDAPWRRVTTDHGRTAWVQMLRDSGSLVRFVTQLEPGPLLAAPRQPCCIGRGDRIELWFEPVPGCARYRIERRDGTAGPYAPIGSVAEPPFVDRGLRARLRYGYRIRGVDESGRGGIAIELQGTTDGAGIRRGSVLLEARGQQQVDLVTGELVASGGDVTLQSRYGSGRQASFAGPDPIPCTGVGPDCRTHLDPPLGSRHALEPGVAFFCPVRGGGTARLRWFPAPDSRIELRYETWLDGDALPELPVLTATHDLDEVQLRVDAAGGFAIERIAVVDPLTRRTLRELPVVAGFARDPRPNEPVLRYEASGRDRRGRVGPSVSAELTLLPRAPVAGRFELRHQQGWSFALQRHVPRPHADLWFERAWSGVSSVEFSAPGGIVRLDELLGAERKQLEIERQLGAVELAAGILALEPAQAPWQESATADRRDPISDVLLLRTRHGGCVKLAVIGRAEQGDWNERPVTIAFVHDPHGARFATGEPMLEIGGIRWSASAQNPGPESAWIPPPPPPAPERPRVPATARQEVLFDRAKYDDYEQCTFSFRHGIRDDPGLGKTRNHWDLSLDGDRFSVRMVVGDASCIRDLGALRWDELAPEAIAAGRDADRAPALAGHLYLIHAIWPDEVRRALLRVTELVPGDRCEFEWLALRDGAWTRSPGLSVPDAVEPLLRTTLDPRLGLVALAPGEAAAATLRRLLEPLPIDPRRIDGIAALAAALHRELGSAMFFDATLAGRAALPLPIHGSPATAFALLEEGTRQAGLCWALAADGTIRLLPRR
jgi:hypothetical protein